MLSGDQHREQPSIGGPFRLEEHNLLGKLQLPDLFDTFDGLYSMCPEE